MRILVCIKQVPHMEQLKFDLASRRLVREGVVNEINPFDRRAITAAVQWTQRYGGEVVVITMGPPQAYQALLEALAMGCDRAIHLLGNEFAGADSLATARALAAACRKFDFDLVLCGKYSTDAETAQVPPMLAELLDLPQVTGVTALEFAPGLRQVTAQRETDDGFESIECPLPALLSVAERLVKPTKVGPADLEPARLKPMEVWGAADLPAHGHKANEYGLAGSPTSIMQIYNVEPPRRHVLRLASDGLEQAVRATLHDLEQAGAFEEKREEISLASAFPVADEEHHPAPRSLAQLLGRHPSTSPAAGDGGQKDERARQHAIWVLVELAGGEVRPVTLEMLWRAHELQRSLGGEVAAVLIGYNVRKYVPELAAYRAERVYLADSPVLDTYNAETYTAVLAEGIRLHDPLAVLMPSTADGRDLAPRLAARLGAGLTGDCIGLELDDQERLVQLKPAFGGNIVAPILSKTRPVLTTIRPGVLRRPAPDRGRQAQVEYLPVDAAVSAGRTRLISRELSAESGIALDSAGVVLGVGMGIGGPEHLPEVQALADALGGVVGATRKVVDSGWLPRQVQIGLTGRSLSPRLYVALGASGKYNHIVGVQRAGVILAINNDPQSDIFLHSDYGIVGDVLDVVRVMTEEVKNEKREA
jgi:electron transfer flavoprotein alpha subunit